MGAEELEDDETVTSGDSSLDASDEFLRAVADAPPLEPVQRAPDEDPSRIGPFEIVAKLGRGGMGIVYRARDDKLRRFVALKVLPADFSADPQRRRRFLREAHL